MKKLLLLLVSLLAIGVGRSWAEIVTWTSGVDFNESTTGNYSTGWFSVVAPFNGTLNTFTVNLGTGSGAGISRTDAYLAISRNLKSTTTGFVSGDFIAISTNTCGTSGCKLDMTFSSDAVLAGGVTYYFYWVTESAGTYTTIGQRYYVVSSNVMSIGAVGATSAGSTQHAMPFSGTMTLSDGSYYRIKGLVPSSLTECYLCSNSENENKLWKSTTAPTVTDTRYVWKGTINSGVVLQNMGNSHYIPTFTATSANGSAVNYLSAETSGAAVAFTLTDRVSAGAGYVTLKTQYSSTDTWLNCFTNQNNFVGCHSASPFVGDQFLFKQVKKVTFSTAVAVNGGDAVSTIYVAVDGSDSFTLPEGYLYSVDGAAEVSNTLAASAIAAAGTADMTVTVNAEVVNAAAQITNNHIYRIITYNNGSTEGATKYYLTTAGKLTDDLASAGEFTLTATTETQYINPGYAWRITYDEGAHYFTNPEEGSRDNSIHTSTNTRQNWEAQVFYWNGSKFAVRATNCTNGSGWDSNAFWTVNSDADSDGLPEADYDLTLDERHYIWGLEEVASVTYSLVFNEETLATVVKDRASVIGAAALPDASWNKSYCTYSYSPSTITAETDAVTVTMTWDGPFTISSSYASAAWYYMTLHGKYAYYDTSNVPYPLKSSKSDESIQYSPNAMWAFLGNPYDGFVVKNKRAGDSYYLDSYESQPQMGTTYDSNVMWTITRQSDTNFSLKVGNKCLNDISGSSVLSFWSNAAAPTDGGSALSVEPVSLKDLAIADITLYADTHAPGEYFGTDVDLVATTITTIKDYAGEFTQVMYDGVTSDYSSLIKYPATGLYRLRSNHTGYAGGTKNYMNTTAAGLASVTNTDGSGVDAVICLTKNNDGTYYIQAQGDYLQTPTMSAQVVRSTTPVKFTPIISTPGVVAWQAGNGTYGALHRASGNTLVGWTSGAGASQWTVEDVLPSASFTLHSDGAEPATYYATLCLPFDVTISGATAYTLAEGGSGDWLIPTEVTNNEVPAGTPVLLRGSNETATAAIVTDASYAATPLTTTALTGVYVNTTINKVSDYVLGIYGLGDDEDGDEDVVGFYHWDQNTLGANRAYIPAGGGSPVKGFKVLFNNTETGLERIVNVAANHREWYDLSGRRVKNPAKGLYIVNGKKVSVK